MARRSCTARVGNQGSGYATASAARTSRARKRRLALEPLEDRCLLDARLLLTEFSAANDNGIRDEDGNRADWIEIHNAGDAPANLDGWYLTDDPDRLTKWRIPPVSLDAGAYRLVFASEKDRNDPAGQLHTNFKLARSGEYLALVEPDGQTMAFEYATQYPIQLDDNSFGVPQQIISETVLAPGAASTTFIPADDSLGTTWTEPDFDDSQWIQGTTGVGFGRSTGFPELVATDVKLDMIRGKNSTAYIRIPFSVENAVRATSLVLHMKYDDGFVAYLNGEEVARRNARDDVTFDSAASEAHPNIEAIVFEEIRLTDFKSLLAEGENLLAIHGLNLRFSDTDFLIVPEIDVQLGGELQIPLRHYFVTPTPGAPNGSGETLIVSDISHTPDMPGEDQAVTASASVTTTMDDSAALTLHYRTMYDAEVELPMLDDGLHGDGEAGDAVYAATIPAGVASAGQMIRYYVTAQQVGDSPSRWPNFRDPVDSEQYFGTIVTDPDVESSKLPVMHLFMQDSSAANSEEGTRGSVFYAGEFYDNVRIDLHGRISRGFPRKSYDIDFNRDHRFKVSDEYPRAKDTNLVSNYLDPSKTRSALVYEAFGWAGAGTHYSIPVRTQLNGDFYAVYDMVEDGDGRFLDRIGRSGGALYKMEGFLDSTDGAVKKTRLDGDVSDLVALTEGVRLEGDERKAFLFDNSNLPALANYLASLVIVSFNGCCVVNYYVFRDTLGTGQWEGLPWDTNTSLGYLSTTHGELKTDDPLYVGSGNHFFAALFEDPDFNQMYLRRLRTLMDEIYGPPGSEGKFEQRIDELYELLAPDAPLDHAKMRALDGTITRAWEDYVETLRNEHVPGRRQFLYNTQTVNHGGPIPEAQPNEIQLTFGQIDASPKSGNQDEEYIELANPNPYAVDISGWSLTGAVTMEFQPGTVLPASGTLYVSPDVKAFRARATGPSGGQGLFVQGGYTGRLSSEGGNLRVIDRTGRVAASAQFEGAPTPAEQFLRITELMYNPPAGASDRGFDTDDFEYIELRNTSTTTPVYLSGVEITEAVQFDFAASNVGLVEPGQRVLVVKDRVAFESRYGTGQAIAGQYEGRLSNGGERIRLQEHGAGILDFSYADDWHPSTDGGGPSLVIADDSANEDQWNEETGWIPSVAPHGSPGTANVAGDANRDGVFDRKDLISVLQIGKYLTDQSADYFEGDWDGDGRFNQLDVIFALRWGDFESEDL